MTIENIGPAFACNDMQQNSISWVSQSGKALPADAKPGTSAQDILEEIEERAMRFAAVGEEASINLRRLMEMPEEREMLAILLGHGEVSASVDAIGHSEVYETSIPCVWWVRHRDVDGEITSESVEITGVPGVLMGDRKEVSHGLEILRIALPFRMLRAPCSAT